MTETVTIAELSVEHLHGRVLGLGVAEPRLSWITSTAVEGWVQQAYELEVDGEAYGRVEGWEQVLVAWPAEPIASRGYHEVRVRVWGQDGSESAWSEPLALEATLLEPDDWSAEWITAETEPEGEGRPYHVRLAFDLPERARARIDRARLHVTSAGIHRVHLNGRGVGDEVLAPGWTAYPKRINHLTHDVIDHIYVGANALGAVVADGWWRGYLGFEMKREVYGDRLGLLAQLEVEWSDGHRETVVTGPDWRCLPGPILGADLYNGESYDARLELDDWDVPGYDDSTWGPVAVFEPAVGELVAPAGPPIRRIEELAVREVVTTPSGRTILDFGQNLVGWLRFRVEGPVGTTITLRHAEVLEDGELGTRPLRNARATDTYVLRGGGVEEWEPSFTFHGFRYVEVDGWPGPLDPSAFTAVVVHSDMERSGTFTCSDPLLNRLHENVVWGMRGNFVGVPTDCPQRDERLGWTGDLQVFTPTATFLYDVAGFLDDWLADLRVEQYDDGAMPLVVPIGPLDYGGLFVAAAWGDAATIVPWTAYERYGDLGVLARQFDSMRAWVDWERRRADDGVLWPEEFQLGDWLDPDAPPDDPAKAKTDSVLVATAYFARSAQIVGDAAGLLGLTVEAGEYHQLAAAVRRAFRRKYMAPSGRISSDSVTAYALALVFDLFEEPEQRVAAGARLAQLAEKNGYRISTGFVGTPLVLPALSEVGDTVTAYRLLTATECPSWLYTVSMGGTTIWERWDSMRPDGSINPGEMTSFNHYALGAVADWMHQVIGGLATIEPGWRRLRVAPVPGRGVTSAACSLRTPYGTASCEWHLDGTDLSLEVTVPPNASAVVELPAGATHEVGSGRHSWAYTVPADVVATWLDLPAT